MANYSDFSLKHFGNKLKYYREIQGLTKTELANKIEVAPSTISGYENAERDPGCATYTKLAQVLKIDPLQFFVSDEVFKILEENNWRLSDQNAVSGDRDTLVGELSQKMNSLSGEELLALNVIIDRMVKLK